MAWRRLLPVADVPAATARTVRLGTDHVLVCRLASGQVHVLEDVCSHDDAPLGDQVLSDGCVTCPRHGAQFDVATGEVRRSPAPVGIEAFPARITDDGWVEVDWEE
jgi:3-phenylpropionate/trans-cinnamate dioxygenase ferredoxin subunit